MAHSQEYIFSLLNALKLKYFGEVLKQDILQLLPAEQELLFKHVAKWLEAEQTQRKTNLIQSRIRGASFVQVQTADSFNFAYNKFTKQIEKKYRELITSVDDDNLPNAIFVGTAGLGKTHLARALGYAACQKQISVLFTTASAMVNRLTTAQKSYSLELALRQYRKPKVLIIDELGYVSLDSVASNLFFQVISHRHDMRYGTIATTNIPFGEYNKIFASDAIAHAIVDRMVTTAEVFYIEGDSYRKLQKQNQRRK